MPASADLCEDPVMATVWCEEFHHVPVSDETTCVNSQLRLRTFWFVVLAFSWPHCRTRVLYLPVSNSGVARDECLLQDPVAKVSVIAVTIEKEGGQLELVLP